VVSEGWELRFESGQGQVVAAAATDAFGHPRLGGIGAVLAAEIEQRTGFETRVTALGHVQRGGSPTAHDRVLATRFGLKAADLVFDGSFGMMAALRGDEIVAVPIADAVAQLKTVPPELYAQAETLFG
jgi:ATP-dependent phosphofructokinase / diphosphate-dependent phosphofructokinase